MLAKGELSKQVRNHFKNRNSDEASSCSKPRYFLKISANEKVNGCAREGSSQTECQTV